jgi:hypothetical protein
MGTWGTRLLDNDHAWDRLDELTRLGADDDEPDSWAARTFLRVLFLGNAERVADEATAMAKRLVDWAIDFYEEPDEGPPAAPLDPETVFAAAVTGAPLPPGLELDAARVRALASAAREAGEGRGRDFDALAFAGGPWGPVLWPLLEVEGARARVVAWGEAVVASLDEWPRSPTRSLYEVDLTPLAAVAALRALGLLREAPDVWPWRAALQSAHDATRDERGFWRDFVRNVERVLWAVERPGEAPTAAALEAARAEAAARPRRAAALSAAADRAPVPYSPRRTYRVGDALDHPTFGRGVVTADKGPQKIEVAFATATRVLVHGCSLPNRAPGAAPTVGARPLAAAPHLPATAGRSYFCCASIDRKADSSSRERRRWCPKRSIVPSWAAAAARSAFSSASNRCGCMATTSFGTLILRAARTRASAPSRTSAASSLSPAWACKNSLARRISPTKSPARSR